MSNLFKRSLAVEAGAAASWGLLVLRVRAGSMLTATLAVAVLQNLGAGRDPQLALLYVVVVATLALSGGGRRSLDAVLWSRSATPDLARAYR